MECNIPLKVVHREGLSSPQRTFVLLMSFEQRLGAGHILGQFIGLNDGLRIIRPRNQIPVIRQKSLQTIGILEDLLAVGSLDGREGIGGFEEFVEDRGSVTALLLFSLVMVFISTKEQQMKRSAYLAEQLLPVGGYFAMFDVDGFRLIDADLNQAVGLLPERRHLN